MNRRGFLMAYLISYFNGLSKSQEYHLHLYIGPILVECERTSVFGGVCQNFKAVVKKKIVWYISYQIRGQMTIACRGRYWHDKNHRGFNSCRLKINVDIYINLHLV